MEILIIWTIWAAGMFFILTPLLIVLFEVTGFHKSSKSSSKPPPSQKDLLK
jgi:hypothetical protein